MPPVTSPLHARLKRRKPTPTHAHEARIANRAAPKDLVNNLAKPTIHRPQMVPAHGGERDFGCQSQVRARRQRASTSIYGLSPARTNANSCRAPGGALGRVNVSNRYLGNKACKYGTKIWCTSPRISVASGAEAGRAGGKPRCAKRRPTAMKQLV